MNFKVRPQCVKHPRELRLSSINTTAMKIESKQLRAKSTTLSTNIYLDRTDTGGRTTCETMERFQLAETSLQDSLGITTLTHGIIGGKYFPAETIELKDFSSLSNWKLPTSQLLSREIHTLVGLTSPKKRTRNMLRISTICYLEDVFRKRNNVFALYSDPWMVYNGG
ncbi:uncharacterized protein LOC112495138 [Cephus cinctus]|uniref:Uncharacterized protein LOC112495138 n=1 Tax=Cephus cinctus TaxID=211228 RepID=A0AAJ7RS34_CEPCN|nr:uncharacterized protein LOC112495138 [Cephus cinctus]